MNKGFFWKLARENMKKNRKDYVPYMLTCVGTIAMFYIIYALTFSKSMDTLPEASTIRTLLFYGVIIVGLFAVIFLFYTNSFLMKRRKKEFGLYNILGMEKKHIAKMIFFETVYIAFVSFAGGIIFGIFLSKLVLLLLLRIMDFHVVFGIEINIHGILVSACMFGVIFLFIYANAVRQIHLSNPVELLKGGQVGEKEPKTKWITGILGFLFVGIGYYIANTVESPVEAMFKFFISVLFVIVGTYFVFSAGSILLLKSLKKNKKFYYKPNHFTMVSGMIYRMKQNAVGLANICILSTMVLVMVSTTVSMNVGIEDIIHTRYPASLSIEVKNVSREEADKLSKTVDNILTDSHLEKKTEISYRSYSLTTVVKDGRIKNFNKLGDMTNLTGILLLEIGDYNRICGDDLKLNKGQIGVFALRGEKLDGVISYEDKSWKIVKQISKVPVAGEYAAFMGDVYIFVMNQEDAMEFAAKYYEVTDVNTEGMEYYKGITLVNDTKETEKQVSAQVSAYLREHGLAGSVEGREENRETFSQFYGGFLFLGLFLGAIFIMATVLIIYYKQISEGHDDKARFEIMKKVGMSEKEIRATIRSQTLMVFFIPLVCACIHVVAAFSMMKKILAVMNLNNAEMFVKGTVGTVFVFAAVYAVVYMATAREYYRIVK